MDIETEFSVDDQPRGERWDPLGAPNDDEEADSDLKKMEYDCDYHNQLVYQFYRTFPPY